MHWTTITFIRNKSIYNEFIWVLVNWNYSKSIQNWWKYIFSLKQNIAFLHTIFRVLQTAYSIVTRTVLSTVIQHLDLFLMEYFRNYCNNNTKYFLNRYQSVFAEFLKTLEAFCAHRRVLKLNVLAFERAIVLSQIHENHDI